MSRLAIFVAALAVLFAGASRTGAQTTPPTGSAAKPGQAKPEAKPDRAEVSDQNIRAYIELLRSDVRADKVAVITELMGFTDAEDTAFWPIYREYDTELAKINDERVSGIQEYAQNYEHVTDALADKLALKALELEGRRTALKSKYYERFKKALSPKTAARFLQVENQLLMLIDLQIAAALPIVR